MTLFELLKQLQSIRPRADYQHTSKQAILARDPKVRLPWHVALFRSASSLAIGGAVVAVFAVALSLVQTFTPLGVQSLDPAGLKAEAQAIDIQIQLASVSYPETAGTESTNALAAPARRVTAARIKNVTSTASSSTDLPPPSIDDVLQALTQ